MWNAEARSRGLPGVKIEEGAADLLGLDGCALMVVTPASVSRRRSPFECSSFPAVRCVGTATRPSGPKLPDSSTTTLTCKTPSRPALPSEDLPVSGALPAAAAAAPAAPAPASASLANKDTPTIKKSGMPRPDHRHKHANRNQHIGFFTEAEEVEMIRAFNAAHPRTGPKIRNWSVSFSERGPLEMDLSAQLRVIRVKRSGVAYTKGIRIGMRLLKFQGKSVAFIGYEEMMATIRMTKRPWRMVFAAADSFPVSSSNASLHVNVAEAPTAAPTAATAAAATTVPTAAAPPLLIVDAVAIFPTAPKSNRSPLGDGVCDGQQPPSNSDQQPEGSSDQTEKLFEVQEITAIRGRGKKREYRTMWKGYSQKWATWQPAESFALCPELLDPWREKPATKRSKKKPTNAGGRRAID